MSDTLLKKVDYSMSKLIDDIEMGRIGLPDIQRPFVWKNSTIRDLFDSSFRGHSTFIAARISRFEVTSVGIPGGGAISTGSARGLSACGAAVRFDCGQSPRCKAHSQRFTPAGKASGEGQRESPSTAGVCPGGQLNSNSLYGDGASRRGGCCHRTLVSARAGD